MESGKGTSRDGCKRVRKTRAQVKLRFQFSLLYFITPHIFVAYGLYLFSKVSSLIGTSNSFLVCTFGSWLDFSWHWSKDMRNSAIRRTVSGWISGLSWWTVGTWQSGSTGLNDSIKKLTKLFNSQIRIFLGVRWVLVFLRCLESCWDVLVLLVVLCLQWVQHTVID